MPEHFSQISSVPMRSRAQSSGSRSKNEHGRNAPFATLRLLINGQRDVALYRFAFTKRRNERRHPQTFPSPPLAPPQRRDIKNRPEIPGPAGRTGPHLHFL